MIRSGRVTVGRCAGPNWPKMVKTTLLVKNLNDLIPNWILAFARPKWTKISSFWVDFGLKTSVSVHLGPPTVL